MFAISEPAGNARAATIGRRQWLLFCLCFVGFMAISASARAGLIADITRTNGQFAPVASAASDRTAEAFAEQTVEVFFGDAEMPCSSSSLPTHTGPLSGGTACCDRDASPIAIQVTYRLKQNKLLLATLHRPMSVFRPPRTAG